MKKSDLIKFFGNQVSLARFMKLSKSTISQWGEDIPPIWAYRIEKITNGELKANDPWLDNRAA